MDRCETCRNQMLEFLYDLLDPAEKEALLEHLNECPVCQAALRQARGQQSLLATAARMGFPAVRFEPPVEEPEVVPFQPAAQPADRTARRGRDTGQTGRTSSVDGHLSRVVAGCWLARGVPGC